MNEISSEIDAKTKAELEKLKAETNLLELQIKSLPKPNRLEFFKSIGTFITAIVALLALFYEVIQH